MGQLEPRMWDVGSMNFSGMGLRCGGSGVGEREMLGKSSRGLRQSWEGRQAKRLGNRTSQ